MSKRRKPTPRAKSSSADRVSPLVEIARTGIPGFDPWKDAGDCYFDEQAAQLAIDFFHECLKFTEGERAGQPFILERWQQAIVANIFGWKRPDGTRRFREVFIYVPRKNGKTPFAAGIVLLLLFLDREPGAVIWSAASDREQASIVFKHASQMVIKEPELEARATIHPSNRAIENPEINGIYKAISADAYNKHGPSLSGAVVDELHAHKNGELVDVIQSGMGARREPLLVHITTADIDRPSICNEKHDYATRVRDGLHKDRSFLPVIYEADAKKDDWEDPATWKKANPNLGVSVKLDFLEREANKAKVNLRYQNTFKRLYLNMKTQTFSLWLDVQQWDKGRSTIDDLSLQGRPCYVGVDLSAVKDLTAIVRVFPPITEGGKFIVLADFWKPQGVLLEHSRNDKVTYDVWAQEGFLRTVPSAYIDKSFMLERIRSFNDQFDVRGIAVDPWGGQQLMQDLSNDGMPVIEFRQIIKNYSPCCKLFESQLADGKIEHDGNPVMRWCVGNVAVREDAQENLMPLKDKSTGRIDGVTALLMAIGVHLVAPESQSSIYENDNASITL